MKKLLLFSAAFLMGTASMFAQFPNIGILGGSTSTDWDSDTDMVTTDGIVYKLNNFVLENPTGAQPDPGIKFRQDDQWAVNWGGSGFPSGTAVSNSSQNIQVENGTYNITFDLSTLNYSFVEVGDDMVNLTGSGGTFQLLSTNGIDYTADNIIFANPATMTFSINDAAVGWGSASFPSGTATEGGAAIPVAANSYNIDFNKETGAYSFDFVTISLIGTGVFADDVNWTVDLDMDTTDGVHYTISSFTFPGGQAKFRLNHGWNVAWGSADFPSGTGSTAADAPNMNITAGTYAVSFDRSNGTYSFNTTAGTADFNSKSIAVYPNPSQGIWNFNAGSRAISSIRITDVSGKVVYDATVNAAQTAVNASGFASGMYFATLTSGSATQTVRVVKN